MKSILVIITITLVCTIALADPAPYWIPVDGATLTYYANFDTWIVEPCPPMGLHRQCQGLDEWYYYSYDDDGDVCEQRYEYYEPALSLDVEVFRYDPPIKVLDYPLTTGKTWQSDSTWIPLEGLQRSCTVVGTVVDPREVVVDDEVLAVIEVTLEFTYGLSYLNHTRTYWLHEQLGDVTNLVSWIGVVETQPSTWGDVRRLYK